MAESQEMASFTDDEGSSQDIQKVEEKSEVLESDDPILSAINRIEKIDEDSNFGPVDTDHFNIGTGIFIVFLPLDATKNHLSLTSSR